MKYHGKHSTYSKGCRCEECTVAHRIYTRERLRVHRRAKQGTGKAPEPAYVPADECIQHVAYLRSHGMGMKAIAKKGNIDYRIVVRLATGDKKFVAPETVKKVFSVTADNYSDGHYVPSDYSKQLLQEIFDEGYTLRELCNMLGLKSPHQKLAPGNYVRIKRERQIEGLYFYLLRRPIKIEKERFRRKGLKL